MPAKKPPVDFETSLTALETLVTKMEQGEMSLEESLQAFETGIRLTRDCQARLAAAEQQEQQLLEQQGKLSLDPLDSEDLENDDQRVPMLMFSPLSAAPERTPRSMHAYRPTRAS